MAILYKHFYKLRTAFWALFLCFFMITAPAYAAKELFTVRDVGVDVTADSALAARDQAFNQAQVKAFSVLAERMLPESQLQSFAMPESRIISTLVDDYEVTKEQLSNVRYVGTYTFRFKEKAVKRYFSGSGAEYTDVASRPVLILPYYQHNGQMVLWSPYNAWMQAWDRSENLGGLVPVTVPLGDIQDVRDIGDDKSLTYDEERLNAMLGRYGVGEAVLVVAAPDERLSLAVADNDRAEGTLTVNIYRTDRARPEFVTQIVETARGQTRAEFMDATVKKVHRALQKDWKKKTLVSAAQSNVLRARVPFSSIEQWVETRKALGYVNTIDEVVVKSLSPKAAEIELMFQGSENRLRLALRQVNMTLTTPRFSIAGLSPDVNAGYQPLVYELYLNSYAPRGR